MYRLDTLFGTIACLLLLSAVFRNRKRAQRLPPGPPGLPIIGNAFQIPADRQWLTWDKWSQRYGDVMRITVLGQPAIILSSLKAANDLLETRGGMYSDRPAAVMAGELVGWDRGLGYSQSYNLRFREFRRLFHQFMGPRACSSRDIRSIQEKSNAELMKKLLEDPESFIEHARTATSSSILMLAYGHDSYESDPTRLIQIAEKAMDGFSRASEPGRWWVDSFPSLRHIPPWFPGTSFHRAARSMRADLDALYDVPYEYVKTRRERGDAAPSLVSNYLEDPPNDLPFDAVEFIKAAAGSLYSGGAETTPSAITSFILAMVLYPEVQAKAQTEIDTYMHDTGSRRLPSLEDRSRLPYVNAIMKEVWRWNPSVPLGLPHSAQQDDVYGEFVIEKGTTVWANIWSILHDEKVFPDPSAFRPERYITDVGAECASEAVKCAFGFGRRICPGLYLGENAVWLAVASILYMFNLSPKKGQGVPTVEYSGFISHPKPFKCNIELRLPQDEEFIRHL